MTEEQTRENAERLVNNIDIGKLIKTFRDSGVQGVAPSIADEEISFLSDMHAKLISPTHVPTTAEVYRLWLFANKLVTQTIPGIQQKHMELMQMYLTATLTRPRIY